MAKKKGVCTNYGNCPIADSKIVVEVDEAQFICPDPECGRELQEIKRKPFPIKIVLLGAVCISIMLLIIFWPHSEKDVPPPPNVDTTSIVIGPGQGGNSPEKNGEYTLPYGTYYGPISEGLPNGENGIITITSTHSLPYVSDDEGASLGKGDKIINTIFQGGKLTSGTIVFSDGNKKDVSFK